MENPRIGEKILFLGETHRIVSTCEHPSRHPLAAIVVDKGGAEQRIDWLDCMTGKSVRLGAEDDALGDDE